MHFLGFGILEINHGHMETGTGPDGYRLDLSSSLTQFWWFGHEGNNIPSSSRLARMLCEWCCSERRPSRTTASTEPQQTYLKLTRSFSRDGNVAQFLLSTCKILGFIPSTVHRQWHMPVIQSLGGRSREIISSRACSNICSRLHVHIYPVLGYPGLPSQKRKSKLLLKMKDSDKIIATVMSCVLLLKNKPRGN